MWSSVGHPLVKDCDMLTDSRKGNVLRDLLDETVNHGFYRDQQGEAIFDFRGLADGLERRYAQVLSHEYVKILPLNCLDTVIQ